MLKCRMSQLEPGLWHPLVLLSCAVAFLVLLLAAAIGAAFSYAQAWSQARLAFGELRAWYRGHGQVRSVEELLRAQVARDFRRSLAPVSLPLGGRQREPEPAAPAVDAEPPSSKPGPLDKTWPGSDALPQPHSGKRLSDPDEAYSVRPPPLPEPEPAPAPGRDWRDSHLPTEQVAYALLVPDEPAQVPSEPTPLVKKLHDKRTTVWSLRKLPTFD
jgi:hypothetical protein